MLGSRASQHASVIGPTLGSLASFQSLLGLGLACVYGASLTAGLRLVEMHCYCAAGACGAGIGAIKENYNWRPIC